jgi:DNA-binding transcriptional MocR family regulator
MAGLCHKWIMVDRATSAKLARSAALAGLLGEIGPWAVGPGPLYRQLARAVSGAIERGALGSGDRLPAERGLADALPASRGTVVAAYDLLIAERLVERRRGSGTFVLGNAGPGYPAGREGSTLVHRLVDRSAADAGDEGPAGVIDLSLSVLADTDGLPDVGVTTGDLAAVSPRTGLSPWGLPTLRAMLAEHVTRWGLPTRPEQIVVTTGAQQALSLAAACWVRSGDVVVVDDPTYPGAIAAFRQAGARLVGVATDARGPRPDALGAALDAHPTLVYLQSGVHSPTGIALDRRRSEELAVRIARARVPFVEDRALGDLAWTQTAPPLASLLRGTSTVVVGSLSKLFWGGLRIGFVRAEEPLALRLARIKATRDLGTSAISQLLAERLLPHAARVAAVRRTELRAQAAELEAALAGALPGASWTSPAGGLSLWVDLHAPLGLQLGTAASRRGVAIATADSLSPSSGMAVAGEYGTSVTGAHANRVRVSFSLPVEELRVGARLLGEAWRSVTAEGRTPSHSSGAGPV